MSDIEDLLDVDVLVAPFERRTLAFMLDAALSYGSCFIIWCLFRNALAFVPVIYMLLKDIVFNGQSVGKRVFRLQVIHSASGKPCSMAASLIRNLPLALVFPIPIELFVAAMSSESLRIGDYLAGTFVIRLDQAESTDAGQEEGALLELSDTTQSLKDITGEEVEDVLDFSAQDEGERRKPVTVDTVLDFDSDEGPEPATKPQMAAAEPPDPYITLNLPRNADRDSVEDAYWAFVDRFSDDEVRELSSAELDQRCRELAERFQHLDLSKLGVKIRYSRKMADREKRDFIHQHVVAINKARDSLLR